MLKYQWIPSYQEHKMNNIMAGCDNLFPFSFKPLWKNNHFFFAPENKNVEPNEQPTKTASIQTKTTYAKARIFAKNLEDVPVLSDELRSSSEEIEIISKAAEIEKLKQLNHFLNILLLIVSLIGAVGGGLALGGNFLLTIERKRLQIAQLRLLGIGKKQIILFLWAQGIIITSIAFLVASLLSLITKLISELYSQDILGEVIQITNSEVKIFYLSGQDYLFAYIGTLIFSSLVIVIGTKRANSIEPGEQLREI
jgi:putative ABC transport system permease protein